MKKDVRCRFCNKLLYSIIDKCSCQDSINNKELWAVVKMHSRAHKRGAIKSKFKENVNFYSV